MLEQRPHSLQGTLQRCYEEKLRRGQAEGLITIFKPERPTSSAKAVAPWLIGKRAVIMSLRSMAPRSTRSMALCM